MQQRVAADQIQPKRRSIRQTLDATRPHRRQQQPKPGNRDRKRIHIDPMHTVQRPLHQLPHIRPRLTTLPTIQNPPKAAQQKVPAATRRVDHFEVGVVGIGSGVDGTHGMNGIYGIFIRPISLIRPISPIDATANDQPKLLQRRFQRAFQDELFDELRSLEQRVLLPRRFRQVLIQVTQKAGVVSYQWSVVSRLLRFPQLTTDY